MKEIYPVIKKMLSYFLHLQVIGLSQKSMGTVMNIKFASILTSIILASIITAPSSSHSEKSVTPYGDFCSRFGSYGSKTEVYKQHKAEMALRHYYKSKGYSVKILSVKGRFLKANVLMKNKVVDIIIFDGSTGRIRSIY